MRVDVGSIVVEGLWRLPWWVGLCYLLLLVVGFIIIATYKDLSSLSSGLLRKSPVLAMSTVLFHSERQNQLVVYTIHETVEV